jgi:hypothetical protein
MAAAFVEIDLNKVRSGLARREAHGPLRSGPVPPGASGKRSASALPLLLPGKLLAAFGLDLGDVKRRTPTLIKLVDSNGDLLLELCTPQLAQLVLFLQPPQALPHDFAGRVVQTRFDFLVHQFLKFRCQ